MDGIFPPINFMNNLITSTTIYMGSACLVQIALYTCSALSTTTHAENINEHIKCDNP